MQRRDFFIGALGTAAATGTGMAIAAAAPAESGSRPPDTDPVGLTVANVKHARFGAKGDGVADDTKAIQAAIDSLPRGMGQVFLPEGVYKITAGLVVTRDGTHILGQGRRATQLLFTPASNGTCLKFGKPGGTTTLVECSVRGLQFFSRDSTYSKVAIETLECSQFVLEDVGINGSVVVGRTQMWSGANSVGLRVDGHDAMTFSRLYAAADRPIVLGPHWCDHLHFEDLYYVANGNPGIEVLDGTVQFSNVIFDGYQAWVKPTTGFKYIETQARSVSTYGLRFDNVRVEQETDANGWMFDIQNNYAVQNVSFDNVRGGTNQNGWRLRKVIDSNWRNCVYASTTKVVVDAVATNNASLTFDNIYNAANATARLSGYRLQKGTWKRGAQGIPQHASFVQQTSSNEVQSWPIVGEGREYVFSGNLASQANLDLQCGTAFGVTLAQCVVSVQTAAKGGEGGIAFVTQTGAFKIAGTPNFDVGNINGKVTILKNGANTLLMNRLPEAVSYIVRVTCS